MRQWLKLYLKKFTPPDYGHNYDFYACKKCNRVITHLQMQARMQTGKVCPCGALKFSPTWPRPLQWLQPNILTLAVYRLLGCA